MNQQQHLAQLAEHHEKLTAAMGDLSTVLGQITPRVIGQRTYVLDAAGTCGDQYRVPYQCIAVDSQSANLLSVFNAPIAESPPQAGPGVGLVRAGGFGVHNLRGYAWSIYGGNPGERVTVTTYAKPQPANATNIQPAIPTLVEPANPAAGAGLTYVVPFTSQLVAVAFTFTASATVASRNPSFTIADSKGQALFQYFLGAGGVVASTSYSAYLAAGITGISGQVSGAAPSALPAIPLLPGWQVQLGAASIQAGDQFSAIAFVFGPLT